jgi:hypothetical protein
VIAIQPLLQHCPRQVEKDRDAAQPVDELAIGIAAEGTASSSHHNISQFGAPSQLVAFGDPERRLALSGEYLWNRGAEPSTDLPIEIDEAKTQAIRQRNSDRALSCSHEADKEDTAHTQQCYHPAHPPPCAKAKHFSFFGPRYTEFSILNSQF